MFTPELSTLQDFTKRTKMAQKDYCINSKKVSWFQLLNKKFCYFLHRGPQEFLTCPKRMDSVAASKHECYIRQNLQPVQVSENQSYNSPDIPKKQFLSNNKSESTFTEYSQIFAQTFFWSNEYHRILLIVTLCAQNENHVQENIFLITFQIRLTYLLKVFL